MKPKEEKLNLEKILPSKENIARLLNELNGNGEYRRCKLCNERADGIRELCKYCWIDCEGFIDERYQPKEDTEDNGEEYDDDEF